MTTNKELSVIQKTGEITTQGPTALSVSVEFIKGQERSLALLRQLTKNVLVKGRDYGSTPGIPSDYLWDPGAATIVSAFQCHYGERRILNLRDDGFIIAAVIEVPIMSLATGEEVSSGVGASSTREVKHKYRWIEEPASWGYNEDEIKKLRTKVEFGTTKYRIPNPEHGELLNTIIKIASKRAEVDAAETLPGVSSALRELFDSKNKQRARAEPDWATFWAKITQMGLTEDEAHSLLEVTSVNDWIDKGKTLDQALYLIRQKLAKGEMPDTTNIPLPDLTNPEETVNPKNRRDPATIITSKELYQACHEDFNMQPGDVVRESGCSSQTVMLDSKTPAQIYLEIAAVRR